MRRYRHPLKTEGEHPSDLSGRVIAIRTHGGRRERKDVKSGEKGKAQGHDDSPAAECLRLLYPLAPK